MRRREFIALVGSAAAYVPLAARAQQPERMRRIGVLSAFAESDPAMRERLVGFRQGLESREWKEGHNVNIDIRYAPAGAGVQALARELVSLQPDVIFANSTPMARALQHETQTVPIVFVGVSDPIGSGFIASLARPGGNLTGLMLTEEGAKQTSITNSLSCPTLSKRPIEFQCAFSKLSHPPTLRRLERKIAPI